jgi:hypothetical protein
MANQAVVVELLCPMLGFSIFKRWIMYIHVILSHPLAVTQDPISSQYLPLLVLPDPTKKCCYPYPLQKKTKKKNPCCYTVLTCSSPFFVLLYFPTIGLAFKETQSGWFCLLNVSSVSLASSNSTRSAFLGCYQACRSPSPKKRNHTSGIGLKVEHAGYVFKYVYRFVSRRLCF